MELLETLTVGSVDTLPLYIMVCTCIAFYPFLERFCQHEPFRSASDYSIKSVYVNTPKRYRQLRVKDLGQGTEPTTGPPHPTRWLGAGIRS